MLANLRETHQFLLAGRHTASKKAFLLLSKLLLKKYKYTVYENISKELFILYMINSGKYAHKKSLEWV